VDGRFRTLAQVRADPMRAAAANWLATATFLARRVRRALLVDVGTTTADLILIDGGQVAAAGRDDPSRLASGELVYTGVVRTPICAVVPDLYLNGRPVRTAAEWFAVTGDAALLLGLIEPDAYAEPTPDGRPATAEAAARRLARMLCADHADLGADRVRWLARQVIEAQLVQLSRAALQVLSRAEAPESVPVVGAGLGRPLAERLARRLDLPYIGLQELGLDGGQAAPAAAVASLLAEEVFSWPLSLI
jgi:probable H4MPT-linked C1 transfer pathway protein